MGETNINKTNLEHTSTPKQTSLSTSTITPIETPTLVPTLQPSVNETPIISPEKPSLPTSIKTQPTKLSIPQDSGYTWVDLNESIETITIEGTTYKTGLLGRAYIPKEIEPNKVYPIYILPSRNSEASTLAVAGISFCITPAFDIDVANEKFDLYLHFSVGAHFLDKFLEMWNKHWHLWSNDKVKISYKVDEKLFSISLTELKPGEWNIYKIEVKAEVPESADVAEPLKFSVESNLGTLGESFWWRWKDNLGIWVERKYGTTFLVGVYQREFNQVKICPGPSIVVGVPTELWLHFGIGFGEDEEDWDEEVEHIRLLEIPLALAEKPSECEWDRIDWFEIKVGRDGYINHLERHENGYLTAAATSDEREVEYVTICGKKVYSVTVSGTFKNDYGSQIIEAILYYLGKRNIRQGDHLEGYVKLVTLPYGKSKTYISALEDCYWITSNEYTVTILPVTTVTPSNEINASFRILPIQ